MCKYLMRKVCFVSQSLSVVCFPVGGKIKCDKWKVNEKRKFYFAFRGFMMMVIACRWERARSL